MADDKQMRLTTTGLANQEQGFTDCAFVCPKDYEQLALIGSIPVDMAKPKGILCMVGEGIFVVKYEPPAYLIQLATPRALACTPSPLLNS